MGSAYKGPEKRRSTRVRVEFIITYKVDRLIEARMWIGSREVDALMLDLSASGMAILTNYDIPVAATLLIKFTLINPHAYKDERVESIKAIGEVRGNIVSKENEYRLGIYFTQIAKKDKRAIASFVRMAVGR